MCCCRSSSRSGAAANGPQGLIVARRPHRRLVLPERSRDGVMRRVHEALADIGCPKRCADHLLGGGQVHFQQDGRGREHFRDIVKPVADVVGRKLVGRMQVEADQVANGVIVLGAIEAADADSRSPRSSVSEHCVEPGIDGLEFSRSLGAALPPAACVSARRLSATRSE